MKWDVASKCIKCIPSEAVDGTTRNRVFVTHRVWLCLLLLFIFGARNNRLRMCCDRLATPRRLAPTLNGSTCAILAPPICEGLLTDSYLAGGIRLDDRRTAPRFSPRAVPRHRP